jgi:hypothetical protein
LKYYKKQVEEAEEKYKLIAVNKIELDSKIETG